jgi:predicted enzyme related to lactoylglutathione lyase
MERDVPVGGVLRLRLATQDPERAVGFYRELLGWMEEAADAAERVLRAPCGMEVRLQAGGAPSTAGPEVYVRVPDVEAVLRRASALGASRLVRPSPRRADGSRTAVLVDTEGNRLGLCERGTLTTPDPAPTSREPPGARDPS